MQELKGKKKTIFFYLFILYWCFILFFNNMKEKEKRKPLIYIHNLNWFEYYVQS